MKTYKRKFQHEWMSSDIKPKGRVLKKIQSAIRQDGKKEIDRQIDDQYPHDYESNCPPWCKGCAD